MLIYLVLYIVQNRKKNEIFLSFCCKSKKIVIHLQTQLKKMMQNISLYINLLNTLILLHCKGM